MSRRQRRTYSKEFKQQIVDLYLAGKPRAEIIREYEVLQRKNEFCFYEWADPAINRCIGESSPCFLKTIFP